MPLPLPSLDNRRFEDLLEEGRGLIPLYAPGWTDFNEHDPGITLVELFAFLTENLLYRSNRIPERHRRKFLHLTGFVPRPPQPARVVLSFRTAPGDPPVFLPAGTRLEAAAPGDGPALPFGSLAPLWVSTAQVTAVQSFDGQTFSDQTRRLREGKPVPVFGLQPAPDAPPKRQPAFYIGLDQPLPVDRATSLWLEFDGGPEGHSGWNERQRLLDERSLAERLCRASRPEAPAPDPAHIPPHHAVRLAWEFWNGAAWQALDPRDSQVEDDTRSLTLNGMVRLRPPLGMQKLAVGALPDELYYLRLRPRGAYETAPVLTALALHAVEAGQSLPAWSRLVIAADAAITGPLPQAGQTGRLRMAFTAGQVADMEFIPTDAASAGNPDLPLAQVLAFTAPTAGNPGELLVTLQTVGKGSGLPEQVVHLEAAPLAGGRLDLWTAGAGGAHAWQPRPDLDASHPTDLHYVIQPESGRLDFGDGQRGRVVPSGATLLAAYASTLADAGAPGRRHTWRLSAASHPLQQAARAAGGLAPAQNPVFAAIAARPVHPGSAAESLEHAAGRAAAALWAHERLVDLADRFQAASLDQVERGEVLQRAAPGRAATLLDYERLALDIPGLRLARVRAWAGRHPSMPCLDAAGVVGLVILPFLPDLRPQPSPALLGEVQAYLDRRRLVGTRLVVCGPDYLEVSVATRLRAHPGVDLPRLRSAVQAALDGFLHPLRGGPQGRGWPFGRDVYRSEILQLIDGVDGVDHVISLELQTPGSQPDCNNLCLGAYSLVTPGPHQIEVEAAHD